MESLVGRSYGRWTVVAPSPKRGKHIVWLCRCECGTEKSVLGFTLKAGTSQDCGCTRTAKNAARRTTHGMWRHPAYNSWHAAMGRCHYPNSPGWNLYGGRGISFCARWYDFSNFWADMGPTWTPGMTLDRIDTDGDYAPGNCRWATPKAQANNRRDNVVIQTPKGPMTVCQAAEAFGIKHQTISSRIRYGWPEARLLEPVRKRREE